MYTLDTSDENSIRESLSEILKCKEEYITCFITTCIPKYAYTNAWSISLDDFYKFFDTNIDSINIDFVTMHHVTTRFKNETVIDKPIESLITVLTGKNALTEFMREHDILFERNSNRVETYYKGEYIDWRKIRHYSSARIINRLWGYNNDKQDICVNGFLFQEEMDNSYIFLTGIPEIIQDIVSALDRMDIGYEYVEKINCYVLVCSIPLNDFLFDEACDLSKTQKTELLLKYMINYLINTFMKRKEYIDNTIIRVPDGNIIKSKDIVNIRQIFDYKEIFQH